MSSVDLLLSKQLVLNTIDTPGGYQRSWDDKVFNNDFRCAIWKRGCMARDELIEVARWKAVRATGHMEFDDARVQFVTGTAFTIPDPGLANWILRSLSGVGAPMASAILTVFDETRFTVIDMRAVASLRAVNFRSVGLDRPPWIDQPRVTQSSYYYGQYVDVCRDIAQRLDVRLRDLDRTLWALNGAPQ